MKTTPALTLLFSSLLLTQGFSQGFLGHEISLYGKFYTEEGSQPLGPQVLIGTATVDEGQEFGPFSQEIEGEGEDFKNSKGSSPPIDLDAYTIEFDSSEDVGKLPYSGQFNGLVIEDTHGTLPPILSAEIDPDVTTRKGIRVYTTPNSIWINSEGQKIVLNQTFLRVRVTFAEETADTPAAEVERLPDHSTIVELPTQLGAEYVIEHSEDLINFHELHQPFLAIAPTRTDFAKPNTPQAYFRLKQLTPPSVPLLEGFETGSEGWEMEANEGGTPWVRGKMSEDYQTGSPSGPQVMGVGLEGGFVPDTVASLRSPLVDLREQEYAAALTFRHMINTPKDKEGGQVRFVSDDGTVLHTHEASFTGKGRAWQSFRLVLPDKLQDAVFRVEFRFLADSDDETGEGWFIDDVRVL